MSIANDNKIIDKSEDRSSKDAQKKAHMVKVRLLQKYLEMQADISIESFEKAMAFADKENCSLNLALENLKLIEPYNLLHYFSSFYNVRKINLKSYNIQKEYIDLIPKKMADEFRVIPIDKVGNNIIVSMLYPDDMNALDKVRFQTGYFAQPVFSNESDIIFALQKYYGYKKVSVEKLVVKDSARQSRNERINISETKETDENTVITLVNEIIIQCLDRKASDIHIEAYESYIRVRLRIDGVLHEIARPPISVESALISRVKIMSNMDIAETRLPQDGAINIKIDGKNIDFRVNTVPTVSTEKIVMRLLDKSSLQVDMTKLGFEETQLVQFKQGISKPHGMVLVTGPTGSGKTTTLYSAIQELNNENNNIMTAEDPVEFAIEGVNQVMMKPKIGLNFASALRSFLRQDPDIIMLGEIRDLETAEIATKAALTGHLLLSTLHTNSAIDTISRFLNMGIEPFNLVSSLNLICAQRLLRVLCSSCKIPNEEISKLQLLDIGIPQDYVGKVRTFRSDGCPACNGTGTKGRVGVHEILVMNDSIKQAIVDHKSTLDIKKIAIRTGFKTLRQAALQKMAQGLCSIEEVIKLTDSDQINSEINNKNIA